MTINEKIETAVDLLMEYRAVDGVKQVWSRDEEIANARWMYVDDPDALGEEALDNWIEMLKAELAKSPEQREAESKAALEEELEFEMEQELAERMSGVRERDKWSDYWEDAAKSVGAFRG